MTTPNDPPYPPQPGPGGWQPPQYGQQPPQYGPPQYGPPQYGSPQYGPPQYGPPPQQQGPEELLGPPQPRRSHGRGKTIAIGAAAVVLLGGGVATYAAVSASSGAGGSATPKQAVQKIFADLGRSDLIGMLNDLPPGERTAIAKPVQDTLTELQHEGVITPNANLSHLSGVQIQPSNLTFAPKTITINDHVQVVELTGGTITFDADATKLPLAGSLLHQIEANGGSTKVHRTVNIAQAVRQTGHPVRIAAQKVGGQWYPSLLYTIADNATTQAGLGTPNPADAIPARGASSPDAAVRGVLNDLLAGRVEQAIELTSPDEDAVLHDYGRFIVDRVHYGPAPVHINNISFTDTAISGGTQVSIKSITATLHGQQVSFAQQGNCFEVRGLGQDQRLCPGDVQRMIQSSGMPPAQRQAVLKLMSNPTKTGVVTSESGGKWFVNPIRTVLDLGPALVPAFGAFMHAGAPVGGGAIGGGTTRIVFPPVMSPTK